MKKLIIFNIVIALCLLAIQTSYAQNQFAPMGAEWYHDMYFGVFKSTVTGDTTINGITCRHIEVDAIIKNPAQSPNVHGYHYYVYDNQDTVFVFNSLFNRFTPLYVFNVNPGDTLFLPALPVEFEGGELPQLGADSTFAIVIDSVMMKTWDNSTLKTVYSHAINRDSANRFFPYFSYAPNDDTVGVYVQKLGSVKTGFLPHCGNCNWLLDESNQFMGKLRCYHEPGGISVELVDTCNNGATGISTPMTLHADLKIYPNPAKDQLLLSVTGKPFSKLNVAFYDLTGRRLLGENIQTSNGQVSSLNISTLASGIYFVKITDGNGLTEIRKFVKK